jgi:hypothetical protein
MRFLNCLNRFRRDLRRGSPQQRPLPGHNRPYLEQLEDRLVPATLLVDLAGHAQYSGLPPVADTVTLSERLFLTPPAGAASSAIVLKLERVISDANAIITVTGPGAFRWGGSGTHQVFTFDPVPSLVVDVFAGNQVVNVQAIDYPTQARHFLPGVATVNVGAGGTLAGIKAPLQVQGAGLASFIHLNVDDSNDPGSPIVALGASNIRFSSLPSAIIFVGGITSVDVFGARGGDQFLDQTLSATTPVIVHGNSLGNNTLVGQTGFNDWNITGVNAGNLHNITFTNIQNLDGGVFPPHTDTFRFSNGAGVTGTINGGAGFNVLDYSAYTTPVSVDLGLHKAVGVTNGVSNIQGVIGGKAGNILISGPSGAVLIGGTGGNLLRGGSGRDVLIAGPSSSVIQAGSGEAIMIGGTTIFDSSVVALDLILAEWSHTYDPLNPLVDYKIRVAHLEFGGGLNGPIHLTPATVHSNGAHDVLITGFGLDFVFFDALDTLPHPPRPGEVFVKI